MRKLVARSMTLAVGALLISGCSSTGGKSFSFSSLNPANYFAKSKSGSTVPKPSDQMAPTVSLPTADGLVADQSGSGGLAPPSPYGTATASYTQPQDYGAESTGSYGQYSSGNDYQKSGPQVGMYDPNGYAGGSLPASPGTSPYDAPSSGLGTGYASANSGYYGQYQSPGGYAGSNSAMGTSDLSANYGLGGGRYDIQGGQGGLTDPTAIPSQSPASTGMASQAYPGTSGGANWDSPYPSKQLGGSMTGLPESGPAQVAGAPYTADINARYGSSWGGGDLSGQATAYPETPSYQQSSDYGAMGPLAALPANTSGSQVISPKTPSGAMDYQPGNTGYQPDNVPPYTPPIGYIQPGGNSTVDASYSPGSTTRYVPPTTPSGPTSGQLPYAGSSGSVYPGTSSSPASVY